VVKIILEEESVFQEQINGRDTCNVCYSTLGRDTLRVAELHKKETGKDANIKISNIRRRKEIVT